MKEHLLSACPPSSLVSHFFVLLLCCQNLTRSCSLPLLRSRHLLFDRYLNYNWMHMHSHGSFAALPLIWHWEHTMNHTFLLDTTLATSDHTATPYALIRGLAEWWLCHLTNETIPGAQLRQLSSLDDCAYEDTNYDNRPSRHPQAQNFCNATAYSGRTDPSSATSNVLRNPAISLSFARKVSCAASRRFTQKWCVSQS